MGRFIGSSRIPSIGLAVAFGAVAIWIGPETAAASVSWDLPTIGMPPMSFSWSAVWAVLLGVAASLLADRKSLVAYWREQSSD